MLANPYVFFRGRDGDGRVGSSIEHGNVLVYSTPVCYRVNNSSSGGRQLSRSGKKHRLQTTTATVREEMLVIVCKTKTTAAAAHLYK